VPAASANCSKSRWHGEDLLLVKLVAESCAQSGPGIEVFGTVGIGADCITATETNFGSCIHNTARARNSCGGFAWVNNYK
jgi:hypothetical protein